jgi:predicted nucleic acid-binding protein
MVVHVKDEDDIHAVLEVASKHKADTAIKGDDRSCLSGSH